MQKIIYLVVIFVCGLLLLTACEALRTQEGKMENISMGPFGEKKTYVVSPPFEGRLLNDGKPLSNMKLIRRVLYYSQSDWIEETYETDDLGYFKIPIMEVKMRLSFLSHFSASTELYALTETEKVLFWYSNSSEENIYSQIGDKRPQNFECDLSNEEIIVNNSLSAYISKCRWENMPSNDPESIWN